MDATLAVRTNISIYQTKLNMTEYICQTWPSGVSTVTEISLSLWWQRWWWWRWLCWRWMIIRILWWWRRRRRWWRRRQWWRWWWWWWSTMNWDYIMLQLSCMLDESNNLYWAILLNSHLVLIMSFMSMQWRSIGSISNIIGVVGMLQIRWVSTQHILSCWLRRLSENDCVLDVNTDVGQFSS